MTDPVFVVAPLPSPGPCTLDGDEGRHAATVRRLRPGEPLVLTDGQGRWAPATVATAERHRLHVLVREPVTDPPPPVTVTLIQALPKGERSDLVVELATEAGVDEIVPWQAGRCVARWDGSADKAERGRDRWQRTAREAAKQSRRHRIPTVHSLAVGEDVRSWVAAADRAVVLHEAGAVSLASVGWPEAGRIVLVVGPEGGVAPDELEMLTASGAQVVRLGPEVLRTSTAAPVALGALGVLTDRWERVTRPV